MKKVIGVIAGLLAALQLAALPAQAQDNTRNWDEGTVWWVSHVHTKPNQMNAYVNDLNNVWRKFVERQIKDGYAVSYKMFMLPFARDGEPDLILAVEYKNWAAFDAGQDYMDKITAELMGSEDAAQSAAMDREALRTLGSDIVMREVKFKK